MLNVKSLVPAAAMAAVLYFGYPVAKADAQVRNCNAEANAFADFYAPTGSTPRSVLYERYFEDCISGHNAPAGDYLGPIDSYCQQGGNCHSIVPSKIKPDW